MKRVEIRNFRCFTAIDIDFKPGINLLIGDNGSGKTSILKACEYVLGAFFAGFSDENTRWTGFEASDFHEEVAEGIIVPERPIELSFDMEDTFDYDVAYKSALEGNMQILKKVKRAKSRMLREGLSKYITYAADIQSRLFSEERKAQTIALPLFACFSTDDIHSKRQLNESIFKAYNKKNSFGYYECLEGNGFLRYWHKRMLVLKEAQRNIEELTIVEKAIADVLGAKGCGILNGIDIRPIKKSVYYRFSDGREVDADMLPDGYRRIINIVVDIAFRCALLNRGLYGIDACRETKGTVLIDEIDMHLHPSLQSTILKALRRGFPKIQFIVSSHAPMVMTGVENNEENIVYGIKYDGERYQIEKRNTYGMDLTTISDVVLNVVPRDSDVDEKLKKLFFYIDDEDLEAARDLLKQMKETFGDRLPELAKAQTLLEIIE